MKAKKFASLPVVPHKSNRLDPWEYARKLYKRRNEAERLFRRLARRYAKLGIMFFVFSGIAGIFQFLKGYQQLLEEAQRRTRVALG